MPVPSGVSCCQGPVGPGPVWDIQPEATQQELWAPLPPCRCCVGSWGFSWSPLNILKILKCLGLGGSHERATGDTHWALPIDQGPSPCFLVRLLAVYDKHCLTDFGQEQQASVWKPHRGRRRRVDDKGSGGQRVRKAVPEEVIAKEASESWEIGRTREKRLRVGELGTRQEQNVLETGTWRSQD